MTDYISREDALTVVCEGCNNLFDGVQETMSRMSFATMQDLIETAIYQFCERYSV